ncbi:MAG TPA: glutamate formimidoyltransferase [Candidatus Wallbacteria bacterium]|nr:glutamate formimidoyltransferase [Candidatus Wallbacteria bacterium]
MFKIIETVPNFSEGRDEAVIIKIADCFKNVTDVKLLDVKPDKDHNRTVVTAIGDPAPLKECIYKAFDVAIKNIDLTKHKGEHPRMGAVDVVPFIPVRNSDMKECVALAKEVAQHVAEKFALPIFLYEAAASNVERQNLANIRKGEFEGFGEKIKDPKWKPDFGPCKIHPTAGATVIGAREYLIAFNINLATSDIKIADKIARAVRGSSGGLVNVKAMGVELSGRGIVQVSMNMVNHKKTPLFRAFEMVRSEAERYGVNVVGSEIIGLTPMEALITCADHFLKIENFEMKQIIENNL